MNFYQFSPTSGSDIRITCKCNDQTNRNYDSYEQTKEKTHFFPYFSTDRTCDQRHDEFRLDPFKDSLKTRTESDLLLRLIISNQQ